MNTKRAPAQNPWELLKLISLLKETMCAHKYLEIGARHGQSFKEIVRELYKPCEALAIDLPGAKWGHPESQYNLMAVCDELNAEGRDSSVLFTDSKSVAAKALAERMAPFDLCLIDGDHTYEGVSVDFIRYAPLCRYVALHDIAGEGKSTRVGHTSYTMGVPRLWAEIKGANYPNTWEFIAPGSTMGIGVVEMPR